MKPNIFLFLFLFVNSTQAAVFTVLNFPANVAQFNEIQPAVNAAANGDTIYIHGSQINYASFTTTNKKLIYIGPGYSNDKPQALSAKLSSVLIENLSNQPGSSSGSEFHGLQFNSSLTLGNSFGSFQTAVNNILINRCYFAASGSSLIANRGNTTYTNYIIQNSFFHACSFNVNASGTTYANFLFRNNVVLHQGTSNTFLPGLNTSAGVHFDHNVFYGSGNLFGSNNNNPNFAIFSNNIFIGVANIGNSQNSLYQNNLTFNTNHSAPWTMGTNIDGGGNISNTNPQLIGQTDLNAFLFSALINLRPASGSPCISSGNDGKNLGVIYEPNSPDDWDQSRNGVLPFILNLSIPNAGSINAGSTTPATIQAVKGK